MDIKIKGHPNLLKDSESGAVILTPERTKANFQLDKVLNQLNSVLAQNKEIMERLKDVEEKLDSVISETHK